MQKALLLLGLFWAHGRDLQRADVFALIPEIAVAVLVSAMLLQCSARRWLRSGLAWGTVVLVMLSWLVIGAWLVAGTPFSYPMLGRLISEPAMLYTATTSPTVLLQLLVFAVGVPILWGVVYGLYLFAKSGARQRWGSPGRLSPVFVGLGTIGLLGTFQAPTSTTQLALVAPLFREQSARSFLRTPLDPATLAVLQPPQRRNPERLTSPTKPKPHVVLLVLESIRWQAGSLFDRGFPRAVHFDRVYAHDPRSVKTLEALLFGLYPSSTHITAAWSINKYNVERMALLPRLLGEQGYETTYYAAMNPVYDNYEVVLKTAGMKQVELVSGGQPLTWGQGDVATVLKRVTEKLEHGVRHAQPQFIMAWTAECHMPYDYVAGPLSSSPREQYLGCHHSVAQKVEEFTQQLERDGRLKDTLVIVLGDHGQIFPEEKAGEWGHGFHVYEPSMRIPVLAFIPGGAGGKHDTRLFQPVDIPVTILEHVGLQLPQSWVGRNMLDEGEPGRDFAMLLNSVTGDAIGVIETTEKKYVRRVLEGPILGYDLHVDPTEQAALPVSPALTETLTRKIETYLAFVARQWESHRAYDIGSLRTQPGATLNQWFRGKCVTIAPDEETGSASIQAISSPECDQAEGPEPRVFFFPLRRAPFEEGVHIQLELRIDELMDLRGQPPRAWGKASITEPLVQTPVRPVMGEWQTVSLTLPKLAPATDPETMKDSAEILFMMTPLDVPARYTLRSVTVEPVTRSVPDRLRAWWAKRVG
ncbi:MAG: sulfatase-like hydrolase/transferase [Deltaproteobacteria bacterium]|nr:sulfatase-like hydrolase/transferase [Deltaproteobacteria bacterium]